MDRELEVWQRLEKAWLIGYDAGREMKMTRQSGKTVWAELVAEHVEQRVQAEREACIEILSRTEFTSLEHMPSEAAVLIRARGGE